MRVKVVLNRGLQTEERHYECDGFDTFGTMAALFKWWQGGPAMPPGMGVAQKHYFAAFTAPLEICEVETEAAARVAT